MAYVMQRLLPMQFIMVGIVKDVCIVALSMYLLDEEISRQQTVGFLLQICLVASWNFWASGAPPRRDAAEAVMVAKEGPIAERTKEERGTKYGGIQRMTCV